MGPRRTNRTRLSTNNEEVAAADVVGEEAEVGVAVEVVEGEVVLLGLDNQAKELSPIWEDTEMIL